MPNRQRILFQGTEPKLGICFILARSLILVGYILKQIPTIYVNEISPHLDSISQKEFRSRLSQLNENCFSNEFGCLLRLFLPIDPSKP